jgi:exosortase
VIFGQTVTDRILNVVTFKLQDISARGADVVLNLIGIDTDRAGNTLTVWRDGVPHPLNVAEACSGMRMLLAFLALGVAIAYTGLKRPWQRVALVLLGVPVAVAVNVLRVTSLGILSLFDVEMAAGEFHHLVGLVWLLPALFIFLGILWILRRLVIEEPSGPGATA